MKTLRDSMKETAAQKAAFERKLDKKYAKDTHNARMIKTAKQSPHYGLVMRNGWLELYDSQS